MKTTQQIGPLTDGQDIEPLTDDEELMLWSAVETFGGACLNYDRVARRRKLSLKAVEVAGQARTAAYEAIVREVRKIAQRCLGETLPAPSIPADMMQCPECEGVGIIGRGDDA